MGLIKLAVVAGAGMYVMNKMAKKAEARQNQSTPPQYTPHSGSRCHSQGSFPSPGQGAEKARGAGDDNTALIYGDEKAPLQFEGRRSTDAQEQYLSLSNEPYQPFPEHYHAQARYAPNDFHNEPPRHVHVGEQPVATQPRAPADTMERGAIKVKSLINSAAQRVLELTSEEKGRVSR